MYQSSTFAEVPGALCYVENGAAIAADTVTFYWLQDIETSMWALAGLSSGNEMDDNFEFPL